MTKKFKAATELRRQQVAECHTEHRAGLKRASVNPHLSQGERDGAIAVLRTLPRNVSPTHLRRCDAVDGYPRGHLCITRTSRVRFREMALHGELPGVVKPSW